MNFKAIFEEISMFLIFLEHVQNVSICPHIEKLFTFHNIGLGKCLVIRLTEMVMVLVWANL